jgi:hypothetical protein
MTALTRRGLGPDKRAAEMTDSDEAGDSTSAGLPRGGSAEMIAAPGDPVDRRRQRSWVPGTAALLTALIGLSDIVAIFKPEWSHRLTRISHLVPGTLTNGAPST